MTAISSNLSSSIHQSLSWGARKKIISDHWHLGLSDKDFRQQSHKYDFYFHHYECLCQQRSINDIGQLRHCDILEAFDRMRSKTRNACTAELTILLLTIPEPFVQPKHATEFVQDWIHFAAEALLLIDVRMWLETQTLKEFVMIVQFPSSILVDSVKLPRTFNVRNLNKIAGMRIRWTDILSEHLMLENEDTQVAIFHQASALDLFKSR
jgi:hypothetical protein